MQDTDSERAEVRPSMVDTLPPAIEPSQSTGQPVKYEASDLSFLYDFISQCPDPQISDALKRWVTEWLIKPNHLKDLPAALKAQFALTDEESLQVCWLLAINPTTPPELLEDLCAGPSSELLDRVAKKKSTYGSTLATLSYQAVAEIRIAAASNISTPLASIMIVVKDGNPEVRFNMAENLTTAGDALHTLAQDENSYIKLRAEKTLSRLQLERSKKSLA